MPGYVDAFRRAFGKDIRSIPDGEVFDLAGEAFEILMRQVRTKASPFDRWNAGQGKIPEAAVRGVALFTGKARCVFCHTGPNFTDNNFHNVSTSLPDENGNRPDEGRARVTGLAADGGKFLTPTLRQVTLTSPYFHDGSAFGLLDVVNHLSSGADADPNHDPLVVRRSASRRARRRTSSPSCTPSAAPRSCCAARPATSAPTPTSPRSGRAYPAARTSKRAPFRRAHSASVMFAAPASPAAA
jgi:cytochrome c peroxidase